MTPTLPEGYYAQQITLVRDPGGRFSYALSYVYAPPSESDERGPVSRLDERLSYWSIIALSHGADVALADRAITFADANRAGAISFGDFSSIGEMQSRLPRLLGVPA